MNFRQFEDRKKEHLQHALDSSNQANQTGLNTVVLQHSALPEIDFKEVSIGSKTLGQSVATPFYIAGMTAGHTKAEELNRVFAQACEERGWIFGLGSQRRDLSTNQPIEDWKRFRSRFPKLKILANFGATQLPDVAREKLDQLVEDLQPGGLVIHTNPLQEAFQLEGTPDFRGVLDSLSKLCASLSLPVILKETGCGFSAQTLQRLSETGITAVDVSGFGGTHWGRIEGKRIPAGDFRARAAQTFRNWGISTVQTVLNAREVLPEGIEIWGSGGVRSGLDAAKLIALGANQIGYAQPALKAALEGEEVLKDWMKQQEFELKVALFCTGNLNPDLLRGNAGAWTINKN